MTIALSGEDWRSLWDESNQHSDLLSETVYQCPEQLGSGYEREIELRDINLLIIHETYHDDLKITIPPQEDDGCIEFGFNLAGCWANRSQGHNFLEWSQCEGQIIESVGNDPIVKVDIHLDSIEVLRSFVPKDLNHFPIELQRLVEGERSRPYADLGIIIPTMRLALDQILNCPFAGLTKQIYLEAKCLELIALKLDQLADNQSTIAEMTLRSDDIERIYQAKEILINRLEDPPSLLELARQVGSNDCTLKKGFRQVFGTTVFGYLQQQRMEWARSLLLDRSLKVQDVAQRVGYRCPSRFSAAFKRQFGMTPKEMSRLDRR
ncbi:transcriptional regulator [Leptolyngbya sp. NIES-3755]|nr:transcriptional regulator [Leptolyngbya sp. NIES-3755]